MKNNLTKALLIAVFSFGWSGSWAATVTYVYEPFQVDGIINTYEISYIEPGGYLTVEMTESTFEIVDMSMAPSPVGAELVPFDIIATGANDHYVMEGRCSVNTGYCFWLDIDTSNNQLSLDANVQWGGGRYEEYYYSFVAQEVPLPGGLILFSTGLGLLLMLRVRAGYA